MKTINDKKKYDNKCGKCNTWSIANSMTDFGEFTTWEYGSMRCMDGEERWFDVYKCLNCYGEKSICEDDYESIECGETIFFEE